MTRCLHIDVVGGREGKQVFGDVEILYHPNLWMDAISDGGRTGGRRRTEKCHSDDTSPERDSDALQGEVGRRRTVGFCRGR